MVEGARGVVWSGEMGSPGWHGFGYVEIRCFNACCVFVLFIFLKCVVFWRHIYIYNIYITRRRVRVQVLLQNVSTWRMIRYDGSYTVYIYIVSYFWLQSLV